MMRTVPLAGIAAILAAAGCQKPSPPAFEPPPALVTIAVASTEDAPLYLDEIGRCVARELVSIQPQVSGRITHIHFTDGADVKPGDLLFTIDPRPFQAHVDTADAVLAQSVAALELAKLDSTRASGLLEKKAMSRQEFDQAKSAVDVNQARVRQNQSTLETARLDPEYCTIRSPIEGRTGRRLVDVGNIVSANVGTLLVIQRLQPIYAEFTVTENDLPRVRQNLAQGQLKVEIRLPDEPGTPQTGEVTFLDNAVQDATGTVMLRATLPNKDLRLWPGQFIQVRLILATVKGAVLIPAAAPQLSPTGPFVYVIGADSTAELRPVTLGQRQGDRLVVEKGLKAEERVVVAGHMAIVPGGKVRVEVPAAAEMPAGGGK